MNKPAHRPAAEQLCGHLDPGPYPFRTVLVLDDHLGPTESLIRCRQCETPYLLEMLDWQDGRRLYRVRAPDRAAADALERDLSRGSCDLSRASAEVFQFTLAAETKPVLMLLDLNSGTLEALIDIDPAVKVPTAPWRELPCDGSWLEAMAAR
ncbi:MAG: hypothetical protein AAGE43_20650 [Pseudomonadota bacterium]